MSLNEPRIPTDAAPPPVPSADTERPVISGRRSSDAEAPRRVQTGPDLGRFLSGLCFIAIGIVLWLAMRGRIDVVDVTTYWPLILIAFGCSCLLSRDKDASSGWTMIVVGSGLTLFNLGFAPWPILIVGVGIVVLLRGLRESHTLRTEGR